MNGKSRRACAVDSVHAPSASPVPRGRAGRGRCLRPEGLDAQVATPTFAEDVAPILYKNCTTCHRPGGLGPFSLLEYDTREGEARRDERRGERRARCRRGTPRVRTASSATIVVSRTPRSRRSFAGSTTGAKPGDLKKLPPKPEYPTSWTIGTPDAVVTMPDDFTVPARARSSISTSRCRRTSPKTSGCRRSRSCRARARSCTTCSCSRRSAAGPAAAARRRTGAAPAGAPRRRRCSSVAATRRIPPDPPRPTRCMRRRASSAR